LIPTGVGVGPLLSHRPNPPHWAGACWRRPSTKIPTFAVSNLRAPLTCVGRRFNCCCHGRSEALATRTLFHTDVIRCPAVNSPVSKTYPLLKADIMLMTDSCWEPVCPMLGRDLGIPPLPACRISRGSFFFTSACRVVYFGGVAAFWPMQIYFAMPVAFAPDIRTHFLAGPSPVSLPHGFPTLSRAGLLLPTLNPAWCGAQRGVVFPSALSI